MVPEDIKIRLLTETLKLGKIEDREYFSKKYEQYISNSRLGLIDSRKEGSPEKFFKGFADQGYVQAFELGKI